MTIATVGRRGQITLPKKIRQQLDLKEGDQVAFVRHGEVAILQPLTKTLLDVRGSVPVSSPQDFPAIRRSVIESVARKVARDEA